MPAATLHKDADLRQRAERVVPGECGASERREPSPRLSPVLRKRRRRDAPGRRRPPLHRFHVRLGPNYLGYRHPEVEEAVQRQLKAGDCLNGPVRISRA